jgi:hypothetical protein
MMRDVKRIKIYRRYNDTKKWVAECLVSLNDHPKIYDCVPDLREDVKKALEENLTIVRGQIWIAGEIPIFQETYGWISENMPKAWNKKT